MSKEVLINRDNKIIIEVRADQTVINDIKKKGYLLKILIK